MEKKFSEDPECLTVLRKPSIKIGGLGDAPLRLCASQQEQRPNNEHWCLGVPATVELRQAKEKKHALVPGLSTREENWEHANETELTMRTEYVRTRTANLLKYADADRTGVGRCEQM